MKVVRIISGGQTGADRGGLDAAIKAGVPHGGWCPRGRKAEDGQIPAQYQVRETESPEYSVRTDKNVRDSDATLLFTRGIPRAGSRQTACCAEKHGKPIYALDLNQTTELQAVAAIADWLDRLPGKHGTLNVAGQRESNCPGLADTVRQILIRVLMRQTGGNQARP